MTPTNRIRADDHIQWVAKMYSRRV